MQRLKTPFDMWILVAVFHWIGPVRCWALSSRVHDLEGENKEHAMESWIFQTKASYSILVPNN